MDKKAETLKRKRDYYQEYLKDENNRKQKNEYLINYMKFKSILNQAYKKISNYPQEYSIWFNNLSSEKKLNLSKSIYFFKQQNKKEEFIKQAKYLEEHHNKSGLKLPIFKEANQNLLKPSVKEKNKILDSIVEKIEKYDGFTDNKYKIEKQEFLKRKNIIDGVELILSLWTDKFNEFFNSLTLEEKQELQNSIDLLKINERATVNLLLQIEKIEKWLKEEQKLISITEEEFHQIIESILNDESQKGNNLAFSLLDDNFPIEIEEETIESNSGISIELVEKTNSNIGHSTSLDEEPFELPETLGTNSSLQNDQISSGTNDQENSILRKALLSALTSKEMKKMELEKELSSEKITPILETNQPGPSRSDTRQPISLELPLDLTIPKAIEVIEISSDEEQTLDLEVWVDKTALLPEYNIDRGEEIYYNTGQNAGSSSQSIDSSKKEQKSEQNQQRTQTQDTSGMTDYFEEQDNHQTHK